MSIILFDFDGVLADTLDDLLSFAQEACAQLGFPRNPTPADLDALETMSFIDYGRQLKCLHNRLIHLSAHAYECSTKDYDRQKYSRACSR